MGWLFSRDLTREKLIKERTADWENANGKGRCIAHCTRGNCLWKVVEFTYFDETKGKTRYIGLDLIEPRKGEGWGYKDMDESCHPYYYTCPLQYLNMVPVANSEWRAGVLQYHARMQAVDNLKIGDTITLVNSSIKQITITGRVKRTWVGVHNGISYRIPKRLIGEKIISPD